MPSMPLKPTQSSTSLTNWDRPQRHLRLAEQHLLAMQEHLDILHLQCVGARPQKFGVGKHQWLRTPALEKTNDWGLCYFSRTTYYGMVWHHASQCRWQET
eukprot:353963-Pelagomonas_calceolata.AAC.1